MEVRELNPKYFVECNAKGGVGWVEVNLGDVASFRTGPFGSALHASDYVFGGVPVINPMQIDDGRIRPTESMSVTEQAADRLSEFRLRNGDVVIGRRGEMGRCAFVDELQNGWLCGTGSLIVRPGKKLDGRFAQRVLSSNQVVRAIECSSVGTTMINLNQKTLSDLALWIPVDRDEQAGIAQALSDADTLIDSLEQLLTKKRQIKQGAMQELLSGKRRLPGFPGEWGAIRIGDFTDCTAGGTPRTSVDRFWGGEIPWMSSGELHLKRIQDVEGRITEHGLQNSSTKWIPEGCILIGLAGQGKTRGTVAMNMIRLCTNQSIAAIFPSEDYDSDFLYHNLDSRYDELRELSAGDGGRGGLNLTLIRSIIVPQPTLDEQRAIAQVLSDMDADIAAVESRLAKARDLKQGMAQALLTGRIRLVEPENA